MGKIQELSTLLTNQIAAGEVVERPASVIKELVENAIDANSTQIDVIIEEAGLSKIQVIDNGDGIEPDDAIVAFKRHATSKLYTKEDLFKIKTLGFRGEALPSIASVSYVTLETSTGTSVGTYVKLKAGDVIEHRSASARKGTSVTVEQLFFNTPARLKFVSTLQRETANIADLLNRMALSHPHISFSLISDGNRMLKTIGNDQLQQTIAGVYSPTIARQMIRIHVKDLDFQVDGYTSLPELTRASRNYMSIFINGRYIKNYAINNAIIEGYQSKLMVGRYPITVLDIKMDYALVDVNVHPTKQQVRISKEKELSELIREAISAVMNDTVRIPTSLPKRFESSTIQDKLDLSLLDRPIIEEDLLNQSIVMTYEDPLSTHLDDSSLYITKEQKVMPFTKELTDDSIDENIPAMNGIITEQIEHYKDNDIANQVDETKEQTFPELHYFGQMHGTYLFAENETGLYIVDQHAAQERIKYEYYRVTIAQVEKANQSMLVPLVLEYPLNEYLLIKEKLPLLEDVGVLLKPFGQMSFLLEEHPTWIHKDVIETVVRDLINMLLEKDSISLEKFREKTAIMMSCKQSIKANHYLSVDQARALLQDLSKAENPYNCPHGRPVLIHLTNVDMEKMFKRIQDR